MLEKNYKVYEKIIHLDIINKYNFYFDLKLPKLDKVYLSLFLKSPLNQTKTFNFHSKALFLLELISCQKSIMVLKNKGQVNSKSFNPKLKNENVIARVILRKRNLFNFLYLFRNFVNKDNNDKLFISIKKKSFKNSLFFSLVFNFKNLSLFPGLAENLVGCKPFFTLRFILDKNIKSCYISYLSLILRNFSFKILYKETK